MLIEVAFKGNRKEFFFWEHDDPPVLGAAVIVDADRGEDLGSIHTLGEEAERRLAGCAHGVGQAQPDKHAKRLATPDEEGRVRELREQDEVARRRAAERVKANNLVMKISDAEWQWDRKKLTFFFTAERRVDFRTLVRELATAFRTRIELKQIGVRDEAKRLDGIGRCGRQYCSASWLPELRPVNLGVAKDQKLSLNPSQISGACGRLMCCLRYEHEFYVQSRKRFPKEGKILRTSVGEEKVVANDIFRDRVTLRGVEGDLRIVPLADLRGEMETAAGLGAAAGLPAAAGLGAAAGLPAAAGLGAAAGLPAAAGLGADAGLPAAGEPAADAYGAGGEHDGDALAPLSRDPHTAAEVGASDDAGVREVEAGVGDLAGVGDTENSAGADGGDVVPGGDIGEQPRDRRPHRRRGRRGGRRSGGGPVRDDESGVTDRTPPDPIDSSGS